MIEVCDLEKSFGVRQALRGVSFSVGEGELLALVGPNGAGKTTLQRILAALSKPGGGSVRVAGFDPVVDAQEVRRRVGFLSHRPLLYEDLSGEENLLFYGRMYGVANLSQRTTSLLARAGLANRRDDLVRTYSRGMKQRLAIARALLHDPAVLLLDEPYAGLDRRAAERLDAALSDPVVTLGGRPRTVLMTTYNLEHGLSHSGRVAFLVAGTIAHETGDEDRHPDRTRELYEAALAGQGER